MIFFYNNRYSSHFFVIKALNFFVHSVSHKTS